MSDAVGDDLLSKQRAGFGEHRDVEGSGEPIDDRAQPFQRLTGVARFGPQSCEIADGIQFEQARSLSAVRGMPARE